MSIDIKLSKTQLSKITQLDILFRKILGNLIVNLGKKALLDFAVSLDKDV